jgi:uncharacterized protein (TIGR02186 family)
MIRGRALLVALACLVSAPATAERLVASASVHQVMITSSFTGLDIVLFGTVERDAASVPRSSGYDIVATIRGPKQSLVTRRKERLLGIWVNAESRDFVEVPSYLAMLSTRPFDAFISADVQRRLQVGLRNVLLPQRIGPDLADVVRDDPFREAFLRLKTSRHLYIEQTSAVTFLTPTLFRATIPLSAEVLTGNYDIDVKLFADGALIARTNSAFEIIKVGFEQFVANAAISHGVLYGLFTTALALMTGWFASIVFRRD